MNNKNYNKIEYYVRINALVLNKKLLCLFFVLIVIGSGTIMFFGRTRQTVQPVSNVIVIDAGHGGVDGGAVGDSGVTESYLNLQYAKELQLLCENAGLKVVMTRSDMSGLYSPLAQNKKKSEMEKREGIINSSGARCVVSVHMNSFPSSKSRGAQVFFRKENESGRAFAKSVQNKLFEIIDFAKEVSLPGDYFVLNCTNIPAILIECGFLSNPEEERLLCEAQYRLKFCKAVLEGIIIFFDM